MTLDEIRSAIAALPSTLPPAEDRADATMDRPDGGGAAAEPMVADPLQVVSRQGRLILRLSAALEALEGRTRDLADGERALRADAERATEALHAAERRSRQLALEAVHLLDALDGTAETSLARGDARLAAQVTAAQRDCLRRLAALGISEIPAPRGSAMDGRLHEGLEAVPATDASAEGVPRYHIVALLRRGYQWGADVLRRAGVATTA
jgi:molecular chaperone GrpE (heat shock protein)